MTGRGGLLLVSALAVFAARPAAAQTRDFCADRPGQTTPPCTLAPGQLMVETAGAVWSVDASPDQRTDTISFASTQLRAGLTSRLEAQLGWTPLGIQTSRDRTTGILTHQNGIGDVSVGLLYGLAGDNGPVALQAVVTLPSGGAALGAGDWSAALRLPAVVPLGSGVQLGLTPEVDAATNSTGQGRRFAYGGAAGLGFALSGKVGFGVDVALFRHEESGNAATTATGGASLAWQIGKNTQLDLGGTVRLSGNSPNMALYFGIARRF